MNTSLLREPIRRWRTDAVRFRELGLDSAARQAECYADELEQVVTEWELEPLTLEQAEQESGYSYSMLEKGARTGRIRNVGAKGSPRIRRCDLPVKASGRQRARPLLAELVQQSAGS